MDLKRRAADDDAPRLAFERRATELGVEVSRVGDAADDRRYRQEYRRFYKGKERVLDLHAKRGAGFDPTQLFRCYFFYDEDEQSVVVGHLPTHLTNRKT